MAADTMPPGELTRDAQDSTAEAPSKAPAKKTTRKKPAGDKPTGDKPTGDKAASARSNARKPRSDTPTRLTPKAAALPREVGGLVFAAFALVMWVKMVQADHRGPRRLTPEPTPHQDYARVSAGEQEQ